MIRALLLSRFVSWWVRVALRVREAQLRLIFGDHESQLREIFNEPNDVEATSKRD